MMSFKEIKINICCNECGCRKFENINGNDADDLLKSS